MGEIHIRSAVSGDEQAVTELWATLLREQAALDNRLEVSEDAAARWQNDFPEWVRSEVCGLFVAASEGELVGFAAAHPWYPPPIYAPFSAVHLNELYVVPSARRQGVGTRLVRAVRAWAATLGATQLRLGVLAENAGGLAFWKQAGGRPFSTTVTLPVDDSKGV